MRLPTGEQGPQPPITVIRTKGNMTAKYDAAVDFLLEPGDVVQVGSLLPPSLELPPTQVGLSREQKAEGGALLQAGDAAALRTPTVGSARPHQ
jgi:polysaccharide export outer membrane protein